MNILIIDDEPIKKEMIAFNIKSINPTANIIGVSNYQEAIQFISENTEYIDLILLDWCFPADNLYSSRARYGMGRHVLSNMKLQGINIRVVICTDDQVSINREEYPFVDGILTFNKTMLFKKNLEKYINQGQEEQEDIKVRTLKQMNSGYKRRKSSQPWWMK